MKALPLGEVLEATRGRPLGSLPDCLIEGVVTDSRKAGPRTLFLAIRGERLDGHAFVADALGQGTVAAMVSDPDAVGPGTARDRLIVVDDTITALGRLASRYRECLSGSVIAVTGSNGKTTTKSMIRHVLLGAKRGRAAERSFNNHIGVPLTLLSATPSDEFLVTELGTSAPGEIDALASMTRPDIAVVTNVGLAHLEGLGDLSGVAREKLSLLDHLEPGGLAVVNIDEPLVREQLARWGAPAVVTFGIHDEADLRATDVRTVGRRVAFRINGRDDVMLSVMGEHNASNALAAYAVARRLGLSHDLIIERLQCFEMPEMRLNIVQMGSMLVVNDSYNANPTSMRAAIESFRNLEVAGRRVAIIGDMRELGEAAEHLHREIGRLVAGSDIDVLIGVGRHAHEICDEAGRCRPGRLELQTADRVEDLHNRLPAMLRPRDTILLKGSRALRLERLLEQWPGDGGT